MGKNYLYSVGDILLPSQYMLKNNKHVLGIILSIKGITCTVLLSDGITRKLDLNTISDLFDKF